MLEDDSDIWAFATGVYAQSGTEKAALTLQDDFGADVVLVLFLIWLGLGGRRTGAREMPALLSLAGHWQEGVVAPLRKVRRQIKAGSGASRELYESLKAIELESERLELRGLLAAPAFRGFAFELEAGSKATAMANLQDCFEAADKATAWPQIKDSAELIVDRAAAWLRR